MFYRFFVGFIGKFEYSLISSFYKRYYLLTVFHFPYSYCLITVFYSFNIKIEKPNFMLLIVL